MKEKENKSKKFCVYIYQGKNGGGNIYECDSRGKIISTSTQYQFNDKKEAMKNFGEILDRYCR